MRIEQWIDAWEAQVPLTLQAHWDHSGPQWGRLTQTLRGVVVALDLEEEVVEAAEQTGSNFIFTHHPILFHPLSSVTDADARGRLLLRAAEAGIALYASHTPLDCVPGGVNDVLAERLGLDSVQVFFSEEEADDPARVAQGIGLGRIGQREACTPEQLARHIQERLNAPHLVYYPGQASKLRRLAVIGGAGGSEWRAAKAAGAEALITGDIKYHDALDALHAGLALFDAGHYWTEVPVFARVRRFHETLAPEIPFSFVPQRAQYLRHVIQ